MTKNNMDDQSKMEKELDETEVPTKKARKTIVVKSNGSGTVNSTEQDMFSISTDELPEESESPQNSREQSTVRGRKKDRKTVGLRTIKTSVPSADAPIIRINDLTKMNMPDLREVAVGMGMRKDVLIPMKKSEIIFQVLTTHMNIGGVIYAYGSLEILPDGYGFLRSPQNSYLPGSDDIYISPSQIRLFNLRTGDTVNGIVRTPKEGERFFAMLKVVDVNFDTPEAAQSRVAFENLTPLYPSTRLNMEVASGDPSTRIINLFCPIGKGQRGLIVSPPKSGKTIILQKIAKRHYGKPS